VPDGVHPPRGVRSVCADDEREPLIPTPAYPLTAARFPAFALARFGFAGDNGSPNLSRLPTVAVYFASASHNMRVQAETLPGVSGGSVCVLVLMAC